MSELVAYLAGRRAGRLIRKDNGNLQFRYDDDYDDSWVRLAREIGVSERFARRTTTATVERVLASLPEVATQHEHRGSRTAMALAERIATIRV